MRKMRLLIAGHGRLGRACAALVAAAPDLEAAAILSRQEKAGAGGAPMPDDPAQARDIDAALLCVPPEAATETGLAILRQGIPLVECTQLADAARTAHYQALELAARGHRVAAVVGAGWNPGMAEVLRHIFEMLAPQGEENIGHGAGPDASGDEFTLVRREAGAVLELNARIDPVLAAARVMIDTVRGVRQRKPGLHRYGNLR